jgi:hypothetical protein
MLIGPKNPDAIERAVVSLKNDQTAQKKYGTGLHEHVHSHFNKEKMLRETVVVYSH